MLRKSRVKCNIQKHSIKAVASSASATAGRTDLLLIFFYFRLKTIPHRCLRFSKAM